MSKPWLIDQDARLKALKSIGILDTSPEHDFDDLVRRATEVCDAPIAVISFLAEHRQWFKAKVGLDASETPLSQSVCVHLLAQGDTLVIPDLRVDARTRENDLVKGPPHIRFYAGAKIKAADGTVLGSLCVIDTEPRAEGLTPLQLASLQSLARDTDARIASLYKPKHGDSPGELPAPVDGKID